MGILSAARYYCLMAWTDTHTAVCIATLAAVEAGGDYGVISAPDTLSLGIGQWTQGRAYDLLMKFPSGTSFGSTVDGWLGQGRDSWTIAARKYQYLSRTDRNALSNALSSDVGKKIQDNTMVEDITSSYLPRVAELGLDYNAAPDAAILLIVVMHRWGNYGKILPGIVASAGSAPSIDAMEAAIRYSGEYDMVPNRYKVAFRMVRNHETNGVVVNGTTPGDSGSSAKQIGGIMKKKPTVAIHWARKNGDGTLSVKMNDGATLRLLPTSVDYWTGSKAGKKPASSGGGGGGGGSASGSMDAMIDEALASKGQYVYHQWYEARLKPDQTGVTDCSGFVWYLYNKYFGIDIDPNGTASMFVGGAGTIVASGSGSFNRPDAIKRGDLIICRWYSGGGHVELCIEDGGAQTVGARGPDGHPEPGGPTNAMTLFTGCDWQLRRYV